MRFDRRREKSRVGGTGTPRDSRLPAAVAQILLVEDDGDTADILVEFFHESGLEIRWARTGREAVEQASKGDLLAAFVDLSLPDMDGAALVSDVRKLLPGAWIAAVTGYSRSALAAELVRLVDEVFEKPADPGRLLTFAREALSRDAAPRR